MRLLGQTVPFGAALLFEATNLPHFKFHVEICEDLWVPIPPSSYAALGGATLLLNLSASNVTVGKSAYRHGLAASQSARCLAAYLYSSAGQGESTTDLAWDGQSLIYENGQLLAESQRFAADSHLITADVDLERLARERLRQTSFGQSAARHADRLARFRCVPFTLATRRPRPRCGAAWSATPTCPRTAHGATSAATRSTTSRCRAWRSACGQRHRRSW